MRYVDPAFYGRRIQLDEPGRYRECDASPMRVRSRSVIGLMVPAMNAALSVFCRSI